MFAVDCSLSVMNKKMRRVQNYTRVLFQRNCLATFRYRKFAILNQGYVSHRRKKLFLVHSTRWST